MGIFDVFHKNPESSSMIFPSFNFNLPEPQKIGEGGIADLEGKWKGMVLQEVNNYDVREILPYNPSVDYANKFEIAGWAGIGSDYGPAPVHELRNWEFFDNRIIRSWKEIVSLETTITIEKNGAGQYRFRDLDLYNKFNVQSYNWYYEKNHSFLRNFMDNGKSMQEQLNENSVGMEIRAECDVGIFKQGSYFVPINFDHLNEQINVEKPIDPEGNNIMKLTEYKEPFGIQQISSDKLIFHKSMFEERVTNQAGIMIIRSKRLVSQYRAEFLRIHEKASTQINVEGDYVDDRDTIIQDSVINRSNIGPGVKSKAEQIREIKDLLDSGAIVDDEFKQMKKEILGK
tara:strand:- start:18 stop:1046 length:1029 start_codon:yes stop_codon:yes gene_type:complete